MQIKDLPTSVTEIFEHTSHYNTVKVTRTSETTDSNSIIITITKKLAVERQAQN